VLSIYLAVAMSYYVQYNQSFKFLLSPVVSSLPFTLLDNQDPLTGLLLALPALLQPLKPMIDLDSLALGLL
jgi:hypothetical protein